MEKKEIKYKGRLTIKVKKYFSLKKELIKVFVIEPTMHHVSPVI